MVEAAAAVVMALRLAAPPRVVPLIARALAWLTLLLAALYAELKV